MPNTCQGCTEEQTQMYNLFYSCSSLQAVHFSIAEIGLAFERGTPTHNSLNHICNNCPNCSHHEKALFKTCNDWFVIRDGWDNSSPEYPDNVRKSMTSLG